MIRKTLHDEINNEDYYYESERGNIWHEVWPEEEESEDEDKIENNVEVVFLERSLSTAGPVRVENPSDDIHTER